MRAEGTGRIGQPSRFFTFVLTSPFLKSLTSSFFCISFDLSKSGVTSPDIVITSSAVSPISSLIFAMSASRRERTFSSVTACASALPFSSASAAILL